MNERLLSRKEQLVLEAASLGLLGSSALSGCSAPSVDQDITPEERYGHDYVEIYTPDGLDGCLLDTPYAISIVNSDYSIGLSTYVDNPASISYDSNTDILSVLPYGSGATLELTGLDQYDHGITAANAESQDILNTYGCETAEYANE